MVNSTIYVDVTKIHVNDKKLRKLSRVKIEQYARDIDCGDDFPPIVVQDCGDFYTISDGRHRFQAQLSLGYRTVAITDA